MEIVALGRVTSALAGGLSTGFLAGAAVSTPDAGSWARAGEIDRTPKAAQENARTKLRKRMIHLTPEFSKGELRAECPESENLDSRRLKRAASPAPASRKSFSSKCGILIKRARSSAG